MNTLLLNGGIVPPKGTTALQLSHAIRGCGARDIPIAGTPARGTALQAMILRFARCLRANGASVSKPDLSGGIPVLKVIVPPSLQRHRLEAQCVKRVEHYINPRPSGKNRIEVGNVGTQK
jgi:hypothetical protein